MLRKLLAPAQLCIYYSCCKMLHLRLLVLSSLLYSLIENGEAASSSRIIQGEPADIANYPYMVSLRRGNLHFCGGALMDERHVLTAAHCVAGKPKTFLAHTATSFTRERGRVHRVAGYKVHPRYNGTEAASWVHDIAVITLKDAVTFDATQRPIELPREDVEDGKAAIITGWGRVSKSARPNQLQKLDTTLMTAGRCQAVQKNKIHDTHVCAFKSRQTGACFGDSGSPLAADGVVVGVTSWIEGDVCAVGYPDVYTKVYHYLDFIQSVVKSD